MITQRGPVLLGPTPDEYADLRWLAETIRDPSGYITTEHAWFVRWLGAPHGVAPPNTASGRYGYVWVRGDAASVTRVMIQTMHPNQRDTPRRYPYLPELTRRLWDDPVALCLAATHPEAWLADTLRITLDTKEPR